MAESSAAGNSSSSKSLMLMMIALFAGFSVLLGGGLFMASRILRAMGTQASTSRDTVRTPTGNFRMEQESAVGPGLPVYSRSSLVLPGENALTEAAKNRKNGVSVVTYHSPDTREMVDNWYSQHLSAEYKRHDAGEQPLPEIFRNASVTDNDIAFVAERGQQTRIVALSLDATGTRILLIRMDKPAAQ